MNVPLEAREHKHKRTLATAIAYYQISGTSWFPLPFSILYIQLPISYLLRLFVSLSIILIKKTP